MITAAPPGSPSIRRRARSKPLSSPSETSTNTTSGRSNSTCWSASADVNATPTTFRPCRSSSRRAAARNCLLSSTIRHRVTQSDLQAPRESALQLAGILVPARGATSPRLRAALAWRSIRGLLGAVGAWRLPASQGAQMKQRGQELQARAPANSGSPGVGDLGAFHRDALERVHPAVPHLAQRLHEAVAHGPQELAHLRVGRELLAVLADVAVELDQLDVLVAEDVLLDATEAFDAAGDALERVAVPFVQLAEAFVPVRLDFEVERVSRHGALLRLVKPLEVSVEVVRFWLNPEATSRRRSCGNIPVPSREHRCAEGPMPA